MEVESWNQGREPTVDWEFRMGRPNRGLKPAPRPPKGDTRRARLSSGIPNIARPTASASERNESSGQKAGGLVRWS